MIPPKSDDSLRAEELLEVFFDKSISPEQATELLEIWERNPEVKRESFENYHLEHEIALLIRLRDRPFSLEAENHTAPAKSEQDAAARTIPASLENKAHEKTGERRAVTPKRRRFVRNPVIVALSLFAVFCLVGIGIILGLSGRREAVETALSGKHAPQDLFGQVVRLHQAQWIDPIKSLSTTGQHGVSCGERLRLKSGSIEIACDAGVHLTIEGPADIELIDPKKIKISFGKFTANVRREGIGFTIETPSGVIIDQGTEFGVDVGNQGDTKVVVYRGNVDVYHRPDSNDPARFAMNSKPVSLNMGEALLFRQNTDPEPVSTVVSDHFLPAAISRTPKPAMSQSVITSVRDNIRDQTKKFYEIVPRGFGEDVPAYVDRRHEWNGVTTEGLPEFLVGGDMVRTFNEDKFRQDFQMTVTLSAPARFFVLYDDRSAVPDWLRRDFVVTDYRVGLDEGIFPHEYEKHYDRMKLTKPEDRIPSNFTATRICEVGPGNNVDYIFTVWERKTTEPGEIKLGGLPPQEGKNPLHQSFYGIVAVPIYSANENIEPGGVGPR